MDLTGICLKCVHNSTCDQLCAFADDFVNGPPGQQVYERKKGNRIFLFSQKNHVNETSLLGNSDNPDSHFSIDLLFSDISPNPFEGFSPKLKQTVVFIYHFFHKWSYNDIAVMLDASVDNVQKIYAHALDRLRKALDILDDIDIRYKTLQSAEYCLKRNEEATGRLNKGQRWFVLNKALGLTIAEIAKLDGVKTKNVQHKVKSVADQIKAGTLTLLDPTPAEVEKATERLEKKKERDIAYVKKNKGKKAEYDRKRYVAAVNL